ncbi:MAG: D-alanyl-D-alanine carboxypeptidase [Clostridia bacterium]|nr:D-alanyl-D-alanine carboxypeptidase [Clostridia bacterium]
MMRRIKFLVIIALLFSVLIFSGEKAEAFTVSKAEAVMEVSSGRMLSENDADAKLPMASTTKIVTAITVIDNFDVEKEVVVPEQSVGTEGSSIYLRTGEKYKVKDLLYGLMLRSGNDAAETLALTLCGSISNFVKLMNETAVKTGATHSNFINPHGLPDNKHYTTARDLAVISCYAMKNPLFKEIVSAKKHVATELTTGEKKLWINKNKMLFNFDGADGVKTGYTVKAGRCLVSSAARDGMEVVCVVLNSPQMFERSAELLENAFSEFRLIKVIDPDRFDKVIFDKSKTVAYNISKPEEFYYPVGRTEKITCAADFDSFADEDVRPNEKVGEIKIYCSKQLIFSQNIYTLNKV